MMVSAMREPEEDETLLALSFVAVRRFRPSHAEAHVEIRRSVQNRARRERQRVRTRSPAADVDSPGAQHESPEALPPPPDADPVRVDQRYELDPALVASLRTSTASPLQDVSEPIVSLLVDQDDLAPTVVHWETADVLQLIRWCIIVVRKRVERRPASMKPTVMLARIQQSSPPSQGARRAVFHRIGVAAASETARVDSLGGHPLVASSAAEGTAGNNTAVARADELHAWCPLHPIRPSPIIRSGRHPPLRPRRPPPRAVRILPRSAPGTTRPSHW